MLRSDGCSGLLTEPLQQPSFLLPEKQAMLEAALAAVEGRRGEAPPFLVENLHNSAEERPNSATSPVISDIETVNRANPCDDWRSIRGSCAHGSNRWLYVRCKRRDCSGCSKVRQWQHSSRIANGVRVLGVERCAFFVLTYAEDDAVNPEFKPEAVKRENSFIRWLRSEQKKIGNQIHMEYAKTWEVTKEGRLHTNIIVGPWKYDPLHRPGRYIDIADIRKRWGARVSLSIVKEDKAIATEATKALSPDGLSTYLTKVEQMVPEDWHRAISYSKNFPKLTIQEPPERVGQIKWESERQLEKGELMAFHHEKALGWWLETSDGSGEFYDAVKPEKCDCFDFKIPDIPGEIFPTTNTEPDIPNRDGLSAIQERELAELYS